MVAKGFSALREAPCSDRADKGVAFLFLVASSLMLIAGWLVWSHVPLLPMVCGVYIDHAAC